MYNVGQDRCPSGRMHLTVLEQHAAWTQERPLDREEAWSSGVSPAVLHDGF